MAKHDHQPGRAAHRSEARARRATPTDRKLWRCCLVAVAGLGGIFSAWFAIETWRTCRERTVTHAIHELGGYVRREHAARRTDASPWDQTRSLLGDHFMNRVIVVRLAGTEATDADLKRIGHLTKLRVLDLRDTRVSDAGLQHLGRLKHLRLLVLTGTAISDEGLDHVSPLVGLEVLSLEGTRVTDEGLGKLAGIQNLAWLDLSETRISDAAVGPLSRSRQLQALIVQGTDMSESGIERLTVAMPGTRVFDHHNRAPFFNFTYGQ